MRSLLISTSALSVFALVAILLTILRREKELNSYTRRNFIRLTLLTILFQCIHFVEEWKTGLAMELPALLGQPPIPENLFVGFNLSWIVIWLVSVWAWRRRIRIALFPIWFLAIGVFANGIIHPLLALSRGAYFPGVWTSPIVGVLGFLLLRRLLVITR